MDDLVVGLEPLKILPEFEESLEDMSDATAQLTTILCGSSLFAAQCPADLRGNAFVPG